ncbi:MAG: class I SAM-dependent methyltransferase [Myxococcota bacterium]
MQPNLSGVPETMLWTLHNRASECRRPDGVLEDPDCLRIYDAIEYDYEASFGRANASHGVRSAIFDAEIRSFAQRFAKGTVVNLGEGLETQALRLADLDLDWLSVDVPDAIATRERFMQEGPRRRHIACSVLDRAWMEEVAPGPTFVTAQGLLMYLPDDTIDPLFRDLAARFPGGWVAFDTIPGWFSRRTTSERGLRLTPSYTAPPMPFGVSRTELPRRITSVVPGARVREMRWFFPRGLTRYAFPVFRALPFVGAHVPAVWCVELPGTPPAGDA